MSLSIIFIFGLLGCGSQSTLQQPNTPPKWYLEEDEQAAPATVKMETTPSNSDVNDADQKAEEKSADDDAPEVKPADNKKTPDTSGETP